MPSVTVVTPTYNHQAFIEECLTSVFSQTFTDWELVVVDDGSTDRTVEIVRSFRDPRMRALGRSHHGLRGLADAYRLALSVSSGSLVAILEGDDRWPPEKLAAQVPDFQDEDVVLSYGSAGLIDERGCLFAVARPPIPEALRANSPVGRILSALTTSNPIVSPTVLVRRATLDRVGGFWQPPGVPYLDHPTWLLLALEGRFSFHTQVVGYWRRHAAQYTTASMVTADPLDPSHYVQEVRRRAAALGLPVLAPSPEEISRRHRDRVILNRWRLALLSEGPTAVIQMLAALLRTGGSRMAAAGLLGLLCWTLGSDLEWVQSRRGRVTWPSRRHLRSQQHRSRTT